MRMEGLNNVPEPSHRYPGEEALYMLEDPAASIERDINLLLQEPGIKENASFVKSLENIKRQAEKLKKEKPPILH